jgi:hypothetical protein
MIKLDTEKEIKEATTNLLNQPLLLVPFESTLQVLLRLFVVGQVEMVNFLQVERCEKGEKVNGKKEAKREATARTAPGCS